LLPKTRFPENGSLLLIGQFRERNVELERAAVSGEDRCVTTLITAAKETTSYQNLAIFSSTPAAQFPGNDDRHTMLFMS